MRKVKKNRDENCFFARNRVSVLDPKYLWIDISEFTPDEDRFDIESWLCSCFLLHLHLILGEN